MYLFVKSRNQIREIEPGNATDATSETPKSMRQQMEDNGWVQLVKSGDGIEIIWVYGTRQSDGTIVPIAVDVNSNQGKGGLNGEFRLCESFTIASNADVSLYAAAKVNFTGFAIQSTGFTSAEAAWKAIMDTYPYEGGIAGAKNPYDATKDPYAPVPTTSTDSGNTDN
ncbi:MAG: hypothetical protein IKZ03_02590, partial [Clostridia bacterium]|nr:hypothetical protein [Clostridia bacterium]